MSARTLPTLATLLGVLLSILPGSEAQVRLVEKGGKVTHEGQSVTLTCQAFGFNIRDYAMAWFWSSTKRNKELVASISPKTGSNKEYSHRIQGRAYIERDNVAKTVSLTLSRLQKEDSGTYYCATPVTRSYTYWETQWKNFGPGTELSVLPLEQPVLKESGGGSHQAGITLNLKCETSGFQFKTSQLGWYLWAPGHAPLGLTNLGSSSTDVTEDRITTSKEDNGKQFFLHIKDLGLRDSGQYHCVRRVGTGDDTDKLVFGLGTDVTVEPGLGNLLSPSIFLVRSQDAVACLLRNFYPKEIHVSLASSGALISAQSHTLRPMANGNYNAIQIGRVGENDTVTCSVKHFGEEINVFYKPDPMGPDSAIVSGQKLSCSEQDLMEGPEQGNKLLFDVLVLRLLFMKAVAINVLFSAMALIF